MNTLENPSGTPFDVSSEPSVPAMPDASELPAIAAPFVSVIIPVYNNLQGLRSCLDCLEQQTYDRQYYEVVVVDNGSDCAEEMRQLVAQFPQARYVQETTPGSYAARNGGIRVAKGEAIAFTDADCLPAPDWIEQGTQVLRQHPNCGLVAGHIEMTFDEQLNAVQLYESITALTQQKFLEQDHYGATANVFTWRHVLEVVGEFDQTLKSSGDVEWGQRVYRAGYPQYYAAEARVIHPARASLEQLRRQAIRHAGGFYDLQQKRSSSIWERDWAFTKLLLFHLMPPVVFAGRTLLNAQFLALGQTMGQKFQVVWVLWFVRLTIVRELFRLRFGGASFRG